YLILITTIIPNFIYLLHILPLSLLVSFFLFFFNAPATPEIYTLSLHDALPISPADVVVRSDRAEQLEQRGAPLPVDCGLVVAGRDRKSTRLNSSHSQISYAVFCLKKKKKKVIAQEEHTDKSETTCRPYSSLQCC